MLLVHLFVFYAGSAELVYDRIKAQIQKPNGYFFTLSAEHGENAPCVVLHVDILPEFLLEFSGRG